MTRPSDQYKNLSKTDLLELVDALCNNIDNLKRNEALNRQVITRLVDSLELAQKAYARHYRNDNDDEENYDDDL